MVFVTNSREFPGVFISSQMSQTAVILQPAGW